MPTWPNDSRPERHGVRTSRDGGYTQATEPRGRGIKGVAHKAHGMRPSCLGVGRSHYARNRRPGHGQLSSVFDIARGTLRSCVMEQLSMGLGVAGGALVPWRGLCADRVHRGRRRHAVDRNRTDS